MDKILLTLKRGNEYYNVVDKCNCNGKVHVRELMGDYSWGWVKLADLVNDGWMVVYDADE